VTVLDALVVADFLGGGGSVLLDFQSLVSSWSAESLASQTPHHWSDINGVSDTTDAISEVEVLRQRWHYRTTLTKVIKLLKAKKILPNLTSNWISAVSDTADSCSFSYISEFETELKNKWHTVCLRSPKGLDYWKKNQRPKISCYCMRNPVDSHSTIMSLYNSSW
jgi:hypothetical protein